MNKLQKILLGAVGAGLIFVITGSKINSDYMKGFGAGALLVGGVAGATYMLTEYNQPQMPGRYNTKRKKR